MKKSSTKKQKTFNVSYIVLPVLIGVIFISYTYSKHTTSVVGSEVQSQIYYPTVYSDTHITKNAITSNSQFEKVYLENNNTLLSNVVSSVNNQNLTIKAVEEEKGTWLWTDTLKITPEYRDRIIQAAQKNGIKNIYLSIDTYLDIFVMPDGPEKDMRKKEFENVLRSFITEANRNDITVDAEAGWRNWAETDNTYKAFAILDFVKDFNSTYEQKFRGVQYDIEPYLLPDFETNKKKILNNFLGLADGVISQMNDTELELSFVITEFYDGVDGRTPRLFYGFRTTYAFDHLIRILDKRPNSKIIVMSYRNFTEGIDGAISISKDEIQRANKYNTKVILAQEFGDIDPAIYTFHNTSRTYYKQYIQTLEDSFDSDKSFGGIALHYINAFMELN